MNITDYLVEKSNGLLTLSPENTDVRYSKFNTGSTEAEIGEYLYAMVRIIKPKTIFESGTFYGVSSAYMGQALKDNYMQSSIKGELCTCEISVENQEIAKKLWKQLDIENYIVSKLLPSLKLVNFADFEMIFLDSEPEIRFKELVKFYPYLVPGGYIFIHDLPPTFCQGNVNLDHPDFKSWPFGEVPNEMKNWLHNDDLRVFSFPSPRGFVGFYKTKPEDYRYD